MWTPSDVVLIMRWRIEGYSTRNANLAVYAKQVRRNGLKEMG